MSAELAGIVSLKDERSGRTTAEARSGSSGRVTGHSYKADRPDATVDASVQLLARQNGVRGDRAADA